MLRVAVCPHPARAHSIARRTPSATFVGVRRPVRLEPGCAASRPVCRLSSCQSPMRASSVAAQPMLRRADSSADPSATPSSGDGKALVGKGAGDASAGSLLSSAGGPPPGPPPASPSPSPSTPPPNPGPIATNTPDTRPPPIAQPDRTAVPVATDLSDDYPDSLYTTITVRCCSDCPLTF